MIHDHLLGFDFHAETVHDDEGKPMGVEVNVTRDGADSDDEDAQELVCTVFVDGDAGCCTLYFDDDGIHFCDDVELAAFASALKHCSCLAERVRSGEGEVEAKNVN